MRRLVKVLLTLIVTSVIVVPVGLHFYISYKNLRVDVDEQESGVISIEEATITLRIVLVFENDGGSELYVPPTSFEVWADGVYAGPGESDGVTVPGDGVATTEATITIEALRVPLAFTELMDGGEDQILVKGDAHIDILGISFDIPFEESFTVQVP